MTIEFATKEMTAKMGKTTLLSMGVAALLLAGSAGAADKAMETGKMVHCSGVNSCKGTSDCKTAENACKGQNACKGHGFLSMTSEECAAKGGKEI